MAVWTFLISLLTCISSLESQQSITLWVVHVANQLPSSFNLDHAKDGPHTYIYASFKIDLTSNCWRNICLDITIRTHCFVNLFLSWFDTLIMLRCVIGWAPKWNDYDNLIYAVLKIPQFFNRKQIFRVWTNIMSFQVPCYFLLLPAYDIVQ